MRIKSIYRTHGAVIAGVGGYFTYHVANDPLTYTVLCEDFPIILKVYAGLHLALGMTFGSMVTLDGAIDVVRGTYHYFGIKVLKSAIKNNKTKGRIERCLEEMVKLGEKEI